MTSIQVSHQEGATTRSKGRGEARATPVNSRAATGAAAARGMVPLKRTKRTDSASANEAAVGTENNHSVVHTVSLVTAAGQGGSDAGNARLSGNDGQTADLMATQALMASQLGDAGTMMTGLAAQLAGLAALLSKTQTSGVSPSMPVPVSSGAVPTLHSPGPVAGVPETSRPVATVSEGEKRQGMEITPAEQPISDPEVISSAGQESEVDGRDSRSIEVGWPRPRTRPLARMARLRPWTGQHNASGQAAHLSRLLRTPAQFDGQAAHLEDWMSAFASYASGIGMPEHMKVPAACSHLLPATLRQLGLAEVEKRPATFAELKQFLLAYYFGADQSEHYLNQALEAKQKASESLEAYSARLKELIRLANQSAVCVPLPLEIQLFVKGLRDVITKRAMTFMRADDLARIKKGRRPRLTTYEECVTEARKHEAPDAVRDGPVKAAAAAGTSQAVPVLAVASTSKTTEQLVADAREVLRVHGAAQAPRKQAAAKQTPKPVAEKETASVAAAVTNDGSRTSRNPRDKTHMTCFNCEKKGHSAAECPQPRDEERIKTAVEKMREKRNEKKTGEYVKVVDAVVGRLTSNAAMEAARAVSGK